MKYCYDSRLCHPGVIILDTPLTTFKEKDKVVNEKDESVGKDIKMAVYEKLATTYRDYQIIIFENEELTKELKGGVNYIHFSVNANIDRKGFIPVLEMSLFRKILLSWTMADTKSFSDIGI